LERDEYSRSVSVVGPYVQKETPFLAWVFALLCTELTALHCASPKEFHYHRTHCQDSFIDVTQNTMPSRMSELCNLGTAPFFYVMEPKPSMSSTDY